MVAWDGPMEDVLAATETSVFAVVVVIVWLLDLQLHVPSLPITT